MGRINQGGTATFNGIIASVTLYTAPVSNNANLDYLQLVPLAAIPAGTSYKLTLGATGPIVAWLTPVNGSVALTFGKDAYAVLPNNAALVLTQTVIGAATIQWAIQGNTE